MMQANPKTDAINKTAVRSRLKDWFKDGAGRLLLDTEKSLLSDELPDLFGYHILQLGALGEESLLSSSRISHRMLFDLIPQDSVTPGHLVCHSSFLPIDANSVDVILMPHVLEFEEDPHEILREAERILICEGHLLIMGFNPLSFWGVWNALLAWRDSPPWNGHFYRAARVRDWLGLLGCDVVKTRYYFSRLPTRSSWMMNRLGFLEKLGNYLWPWLGGAYLIIGKKRLAPLTPTKTEWRLRRRLITAGVTEPAARARQLLKRSVCADPKSWKTIKVRIENDDR